MEIYKFDNKFVGCSKLSRILNLKAEYRYLQTL